MRSFIFCVLVLGFASVANGQQDYPNIRGVVVFENDLVVVQHFVMQPGEESGMHLHPGNQMEILLKGGKGLLVTQSTFGGDDEEVVLEMEDGEIRWIDSTTVPHNFKNIDTKPIEWYLLSYKTKSTQKSDSERE